LARRQAEVSAAKGIVLDANILVRVVFGQRVPQILSIYVDRTNFYSPDVCFADAREYISKLSAGRGLDPITALAVLEGIEGIVEIVDRSLYEDYEKLALERIQTRDAEDWPVVAVALLLELPIWTEDQDFFGGGISTWTTDRVELYLRES
jgi:predicted nucleic acid-binding protein